MRILAIETSCDETSAAVVEKKVNNSPEVLSSHISSSSNLHALTGGIIPEQAAREQLNYIIPIILQSIFSAHGKKMPELSKAYVEGKKLIQESIDAIAVTQGPGLIGSLLVGVETAKTIAYTYDKPIIPVNHLLAHIYSNFIGENTKSQKAIPNHVPLQPRFPFIGLIVSGGHTDLLFFENHGSYTWIGGTRDDAAGEALDKIGRVLGLSYPAGPEIEKRARLAHKTSFKFTRPLLHSGDFDFSFSGLKTEASRFIQNQQNLTDEVINSICFAVQDATADVLVQKTLKAADKYQCDTILLGGGVSANEYLRNKFQSTILSESSSINLFFPDKKYTTDNAAMIGTYASLNFKPVAWSEIKASPNLSLV